MFSFVCLILGGVVWWFAFGDFGCFGFCCGFVALWVGWVPGVSWVLGLGGFVGFALRVLVGCRDLCGVVSVYIAGGFLGVYLRLAVCGRWLSRMVWFSLVVLGVVGAFGFRTWLDFWISWFWGWICLCGWFSWFMFGVFV